MSEKERMNLYFSPDIAAVIRELAGSHRQQSQVAEELIRAGLSLPDRPPQTGRGVEVAEELIRAGLSLKSGEVIAQRSLPVIHEIIENALLKAQAQLRTDLREEMQSQNQESKADIIAEMKARERRSDDRLASLIIRAIREGGISRRMLFTYLAKDDAQFAMEVYDDAKAKVGRDIATRFNEGSL
jgi:hypothetical protein